MSHSKHSTTYSNLVSAKVNITLIQLYHPIDGITNPKNKLFYFFQRDEYNIDNFDSNLSDVFFQEKGDESLTFETSPTLSFYDAEAKDEAEYSCLAVNEYGSDQVPILQNFFLFDPVPPAIDN